MQTGSLSFLSGGDINITTGELVLSEQANLISSSGRDFAGGDINITAGSITVRGQSNINLEAGEDSSAGILNIATGDMSITESSVLNTSSEFSGGIAGAIFINASGDFEISDNSSLLATSSISGAGGAVAINAQNIAILSGSMSRAHSPAGRARQAVAPTGIAWVVVRDGRVLNPPLPDWFYDMAALDVRTRPLAGNSDWNWPQTPQSRGSPD